MQNRSLPTSFCASESYPRQVWKLAPSYVIWRHFSQRSVSSAAFWDCTRTPLILWLLKVSDSERLRRLYLNLGPDFIVIICHWKHLGGLHKAQNWTLDSTGCMAPGQRLKCTSCEEYNGSCPDHMPLIKKKKHRHFRELQLLGLHLLF